MNADNSFADGSWAMFNVANFVAGDSPSSGPDHLYQQMPSWDGPGGQGFASAPPSDMVTDGCDIQTNGNIPCGRMAMNMDMGVGWTGSSPPVDDPNSYGMPGLGFSEYRKTQALAGSRRSSPALLPSATSPMRWASHGKVPHAALPTASPAGPATPGEAQDWSYAIDVWPAEDLPGESCVSENYLRIDRELTKKRFDWSIVILQSPVDGSSFRRYVIEPNKRSNEKLRLQFMQVFNANRHYNKNISGYKYVMSVVYEPRQFHSSDGYPVITGLDGQDDGAAPDATYGDDNDVTDLAAYTPNTQPLLSPEPHLEIVPVSVAPQAPVALPTPKEESDTRIPQRAKAIPKPEREISKNARGKYECTWQACSESVREFNRKCEWSKHMDKHERPFKCIDPACEKLSGFTYSGGLLRHQREVHGEYGGPKNPLNCPHVNCKRHTGKGFSRLENLNEHLRRVHTSTAGGGSGDEVVDEIAAVVQGHSTTPAPQPLQLQSQSQSPVVLGDKRKADDDVDLRGEVKRLHTMNETLQQQLAAQKAQSEAKEEAQKQQMMAMMASMHELKERLGQAEEQLRQQRGSILDETHSFP